MLKLQEELALQAAPVVSERVFIYSQKRPAMQTDVDLMKQHQDRKVRVYVYHESRRGSPADEGSEAMESEWTMIDDGKAVGVFKSVDPAGFRAFWYFGDRDKKAQYEGWRRMLKISSEPLEDWLKKHAAQTPKTH